jgi:monomeric sarcosine oxidase
MKIAVVGIGGTGSAALRFLAAAGHEAAGFEQFQVGHTNGSSHGESRIIRYTYPESLYTAMMSDAYPLWAALEAEAQEELFVRCGGVYLGPKDHPKVRSTEAALIENNLPYEKLSPAAARDRVPGLNFFADEVAIFQRESGFLRSSQCVLANARLAQQHGATIHENTSVQAIIPHGDKVVVRTAHDEQVFDRAIVTAGAWMGQIFAQLDLPLRVTRQQIVYLRVRESEDAKYFQPGRFPVWIDAGAGYYGFPDDGRIPGVKFAAHEPGDVVDPDDVNRVVDGAYIERAVQFASLRLPHLSADVTESVVCLYTNTPNEDFILDQMPDAPNVWLVSGCSGHGFKFTVLLGHIAATLATGGSYSRDLSRFALQNVSHR